MDETITINFTVSIQKQSGEFSTIRIYSDTETDYKHMEVAGLFMKDDEIKLMIGLKKTDEDGKQESKKTDEFQSKLMNIDLATHVQQMRE